MSEKQLLTHSRSQSFKSCRRRHFWEYEIGVRRVTDAKALRMGSAGHDGLDALKRGQGIETAVTAVLAHYAILPDGHDEYDWLIERETVECLVRGYDWRWGESMIAVKETEKVFQFPLNNPVTGASSRLFDLAGKIDGVVMLEDGRLGVLEHKFVSDDIAIDSDYWRRLQLDHQVSLYVHAARQIGWDVSTVCFDVIRKPTIRPEQVPVLDDDGLKVVLDGAGARVMTQKGTPRQTGDSKLGYVLQTRQMTPGEWGEKLLADIGERPDFYYARHEIARLDSDIGEMLDELWDLAKVIRDAQLENRWYRTVGRDSCGFCAYFPLCSAKWDPADMLPEGFMVADNRHPELELEN